MATPIEDFATRGVFFQTQFRRLVAVCLVLELIVGALILWAYYELLIEPPATYYITTQDGELVPMTSADHPDDAIVARPIVVTDTY